MAGKSNYLEKQFLNLVFRAQTAWKPSAVYLALFTAAPTDAGGGTEVSTSSTGYGRVAVSQLDANWAATGNSPSQITNTNSIAFGSPTAAWGTVVAWAAYDASTGGNLLYWNTLTQSKTVNAGDAAPTWNPGSLVITED